MENRSARRDVAAALAVILVLAVTACSGDDSDSPDATPVSVTAPDDVVLFDLSLEGHHECVDEPSDVTTSYDAQSEPPVPMDGVDLVAASVELDDSSMSGEFQLVAEPDPASDPRYLVAVGAPDDLDGFELHIEQVDEGAWGVRVQQVGDTEGARSIPTAEVTVSDSTVSWTAPAEEIPEPLPNQPVFYGATAMLVDAEGRPIDRSGEVLDPDAEPIRAFDDCILLGD